MYINPTPAAVITAARTLIWEPHELPAAPGLGQVIVRTSVSLISPGTELAFWNATHACLGDPAYPWAKFPFRPGYAAAGEVVAAGPEAPFASGDRVAFRGRHSGMALVDATHDLIGRIPDAMDYASASFGRMIQIGAGAAAALPAGQTGPIQVVGAGLVGILAGQWLVGDGHEVWIEDVDEARLELARACGLRTGTAPGEPGAIIEATGVAKLVPLALARVRPGGTVVLLGSPRVPVEVDLYRLVHARGTTLTGAHETRLPMRGTGPSRQSLFSEGLRRIAAGTIRVAPLIDHRMPGERLPEAYAALAAREPGWMGVILEWSHE